MNSMNMIRDIAQKFIDLKDEMLEKEGMVNVNQVFDEFIERYPKYDQEVVLFIVNNTIFH